MYRNLVCEMGELSNREVRAYTTPPTTTLKANKNCCLIPLHPTMAAVSRDQAPVWPHITRTPDLERPQRQHQHADQFCFQAYAWNLYRRNPRNPLQDIYYQYPASRFLFIKELQLIYKHDGFGT